MAPPEIDVWFGPGGLRGVFGAGVAYGLHEAIGAGQCDPNRLRLFGSSVGCLNAVFLATGNAGIGLDIYREDVSRLILRSNLLPSLVARIRNRVGGAIGRRVGRVPSVLDVDHVFTVMQRRTPRIAEQLRDAPMPVFSESLDRISGEFRHQQLQDSADPLAAIRNALNCFPFFCQEDRSSLDSGIRGYGFIRLLNPGQPRQLVVVLNEPVSSRLRDHLSGIACATLAASPRISGLYLRRQTSRSRAIRLAQRCGQALLLTPSRPIFSGPSGFSRPHAEGRHAAEQLLRFAAQTQRS